MVCEAVNGPTTKSGSSPRMKSSAKRMLPYMEM